MNRRTFLLGGLGVLGLAAGGGAFSYVHRPEFGRTPTGARLARVMASPHYVNGQFQNLVPVPVMSEEEGERENRVTAMLKFLFGDKTGLEPKQPMLAEKTNLAALDLQQDCVVWMGHSAFYMQLGGYRILIDPVFSPYASPLWFVNKAFPGSNVYAAEDIPAIDVLAISHDHWDHLDYPTVMALKDKCGHVVCPLGVGEYFEQWGFDMSRVHEEDWGTEISLAEDFSVHIVPSQHFSGRFLTQNPTLWGGFVFAAKNRKVYYTGDGGYGEHFKAVGEKFGEIDLMLAENGQYNLAWHPIHMLPEEAAQAAEDAKAAAVLPAHSGKFALSRHAWQEPYQRLSAASKGRPYQLLTPKIGELMRIGSENTQHFDAWWEQMN